jgi:hypothetical protein
MEEMHLIEGGDNWVLYAIDNRKSGVGCRGILNKDDRCSMSEFVPAQIVQSLSEGVRAADGVIERVVRAVSDRQKEVAEYTEPARNLLGLVEATRGELKRRVGSALEMIDGETEELREIYRLNEQAVLDLQRTAAELREAPTGESDSPMLMIVRAMSSLMPFAVFAFLRFWPRQS